MLDPRTPGKYLVQLRLDYEEDYRNQGDYASYFEGMGRAMAKFKYMLQKLNYGGKKVSREAYRDYVTKKYLEVYEGQWAMWMRVTREDLEKKYDGKNPWRELYAKLGGAPATTIKEIKAAINSECLREQNAYEPAMEAWATDYFASQVWNWNPQRSRRQVSAPEIRGTGPWVNIEKQKRRNVTAPTARSKKVVSPHFGKWTMTQQFTAEREGELAAEGTKRQKLKTLHDIRIRTRLEPKTFETTHVSGGSSQLYIPETAAVEQAQIQEIEDRRRRLDADKATLDSLVALVRNLDRSIQKFENVLKDRALQKKRGGPLVPDRYHQRRIDPKVELKKCKFLQSSWCVIRLDSQY